LPSGTVSFFSRGRPHFFARRGRFTAPPPRTPRSCFSWLFFFFFFSGSHCALSRASAPRRRPPGSHGYSPWACLWALFFFTFLTDRRFPTAYGGTFFSSAVVGSQGRLYAFRVSLFSSPVRDEGRFPTNNGHSRPADGRLEALGRSRSRVSL